ncbi:aspartyl-phosphate phosphatase Spo0E family protein [Desulfosporosinus sp. OT]|uniref:aspartyl-phosphate phosphatase Spo0E family protein n=1 Tax=Desulfosporosinus sp. OT TaxID=913865 RepID=UPI001FA6C3F9|nr:aspartyl-phosphate phosphatase Spo0E family protein [Desulfosporosinus sp. OT]
MCHGKEVLIMKYYLDLLMSLIEDARMNLNDSAKYMSLTDPEIIGMSQKLDSLLNEYYSITESYRIAS